MQSSFADYYDMFADAVSCLDGVTIELDLEASDYYLGGGMEFLI